ncbi:phytoene desaturase family protein [Haloactinopolyspora alba]|nr:NAD(P)/FAD-dependent oxidoreductase [Haloactinopolyspora alba]
MPTGTDRSRYDVVVVGGGHNGLTAAAYLARAGRSVLVLERLAHVGGAAVSARAFPGVHARLSRYSYLVSLLPRRIVSELGLRVELRRRRYSSYTPAGGRGLLVDGADDSATRASFADVTGSDADHAGWSRLAALTGDVAHRVFPTMTEPLLPAERIRRIVGEEAWERLFGTPIGAIVRSYVRDDVVRGVVATDALIGTFAGVDDGSLRQNRCFLYHVIGNGTGEWEVPVGGMGAVTDALREAALAAGARITTRADVTAVDPDGEVTYLDDEGRERRAGAGHVLAACAPSTLEGLVGPVGTDGASAGAERPEGSQLKVNMVLRRLPRLRDGTDPAVAFSGTFHVNESMTQLETAYAQATGGVIPELPPCDVYCHSLTDPSILGPELRAGGAHTLTLFGLHMPARLFRSDNAAARDEALKATLASVNSVLAEPVEDCLYVDADGRPCVEARTPLDLERDVGLPGGHIFHRDLAWPFAETDDEVGTWGVETRWPRVLLCGAGARRGGGVSGIPGRAAAMAVLGRGSA